MKTTLIGREKEQAILLKALQSDDYKKLARSQKRHLDLVPSAVLHDLELQKYRQLIEGIPLFVELLRQQATETGIY